MVQAPSASESVQPRPFTIQSRYRPAPSGVGSNSKDMGDRTPKTHLEHDGVVSAQDSDSPRPVCGERSDCEAIWVRGTLRETECLERAPHPNPLPAKSGEREKRSIAAVALTQTHPALIRRQQIDPGIGRDQPVGEQL